MPYENVQLDAEDVVGTLTLNRPQALNALSSKVLTEINQVLDEVERRSLRALIVTGSGDKAFAAGADITEMVELSCSGAHAFSALGQSVFLRLEGLPCVTIAAVNGFAFGGGFELALACDLIYASEKAQVGFPEVGLGVIPGFGGTQRLSRLVGRSRAKELIFTALRVPAPRAKELGLVLDVLPSERLQAHCREIAHTIAAQGPLAIAQAKRIIEFGADLDLRAALELERQGFGLLFGSKDQREGMSAFVDKRKPSFTGQ